MLYYNNKRRRRHYNYAVQHHTHCIDYQLTVSVHNITTQHSLSVAIDKKTAQFAEDYLHLHHHHHHHVPAADADGAAGPARGHCPAGQTINLIRSVLRRIILVDINNICLMAGCSAGLPPPGRGGPALPRGRVDRKIGSHSLQVNIDLNLNTVSCFMSPQNPIQSMIIISSIWQSLNILCYINPGKNNGMESLVYFIIYYDCTFIL